MIYVMKNKRPKAKPRGEFDSDIEIELYNKKIIAQYNLYIREKKEAYKMFGMNYEEKKYENK